MVDLPAWYVDMLLAGLRREQAAMRGGPGADGEHGGVVEPIGEDDWDAPAPDWVKAWKDVPEAAPNPAGRD